MSEDYQRPPQFDNINDLVNHIASETAKQITYIMPKDWRNHVKKDASIHCKEGRHEFCQIRRNNYAAEYNFLCICPCHYEIAGLKENAERLRGKR